MSLEEERRQREVNSRREGIMRTVGVADATGDAAQAMASTVQVYCESEPFALPLTKEIDAMAGRLQQIEEDLYAAHDALVQPGPGFKERAEKAIHRLANSGRDPVEDESATTEATIGIPDPPAAA
jgi:hypothetical protein